MNQEQTIEFAKKYLEDLLAFFDLNLDVDVEIDGDILMANVPYNEVNSILIGRGAETLRGFQYLLSSVLKNNEATVSRVNLDIADYKKQHAEKIADKARGWIEEVLRTGEPRRLDLNSADRWTVHHVASEYQDIETHSEGEGRARQLIIEKKS